MSKKNIMMRIGEHDFSVQVLHCPKDRDPLCPSVAVNPTILAPQDWPVIPVLLEKAANDALIENGCRPDRRDDCLWAINAGMNPVLWQISDEYCAREARSPGQDYNDQRRTRSAWRCGEIS